MVDDCSFTAGEQMFAYHAIGVTFSFDEQQSLRTSSFIYSFKSPLLILIYRRILEKITSEIEHQIK